MIAEVEITGLTVGETYEYSAAASPDRPVPARAAPARSTTRWCPCRSRSISAAPTRTGRSPRRRPSASDRHFNINDSESIHLFATVSHDGPGSVQLALDAAGTTLVGDPAEVVDGKAVFVIPASEFGLGLHEHLHAIYTSDDGQHAGTSPIPRSLVVQLTPTVTIDAPGSTAVYGDIDASTFTVTVSGTGGTPTGIVSIFGHEATLVDGEASIDLSMLGVRDDPYEIVAEYRGDGVYGRGAADPVEFSTTAASSTTEITGVAPADPEYGEAVAVTVTVRAVAPSTADPQGWVTLIADGPDLDDPVEFGPISFDPFDQDGDGVTTIEVVIPAEALPAGEYILVAEFDPGTNFTGSDTTSQPDTELTIAAATTATTLDVQPTSTLWGEDLTLTATVDASAVASVPDGTVTFTAGALELGTATLIALRRPEPGRMRHGDVDHPGEHARDRHLRRSRPSTTAPTTSRRRSQPSPTTSSARPRRRSPSAAHRLSATGRRPTTRSPSAPTTRSRRTVPRSWSRPCRRRAPR